jgi:hypothetical protein
VHVSKALDLLLLLLLLFRLKDTAEWIMVFISPYLENCVEKMALNAKVSAGTLGDRMVAVSSGSKIRLWSFTHNDSGYVKFEIGKIHFSFFYLFSYSHSFSSLYFSLLLYFWFVSLSCIVSTKQN